VSDTYDHSVKDRNVTLEPVTLAESRDPTNRWLQTSLKLSQTLFDKLPVQDLEEVTI
jgi:hypothetical protein